MTAKHVLKKYWGYSSFRPLQSEIVASINAGHDTLALLPTGGGKSICFQVPALMLPGITIVISPLVSLMKDQVDALKRRNIASTYLASSLPKQESAERMQLLQLGKYKIIYVSPERLVNKQFLKLILKQQISQLVVDEAHCISEWGHSFRPNYRLIAKFIDTIQPRPTITAVTATATRATARDILSQLKMQQPQIFSKSFQREIKINIFEVKSRAQQEIHLLRLLIKHRQESGIIYCSTRNTTEKLSTRLSQLSHQLQLAKPGYYHGGMSAADRSAIQQLFLHDKVQVLCATNAFGMGIDKPNVSYVIHYQLPSSIEQYYQEIGRAGRGGQTATAYLLFNKNQLNINYQLIAELKDRQQKKRQTNKLNAMIKLASQKKCVTREILKYFGELASKCDNCSNCRHSSLPSSLQSLNQANEKQALRKILFWREKMADQIKLHPLYILSDTQAQLIALLKPTNQQQLLQMRGFGLGWINSFGYQLLAANLY